jgi:hypothetical protein
LVDELAASLVDELDIEQVAWLEIFSEFLLAATMDHGKVDVMAVLSANEMAD